MSPPLSQHPTSTDQGHIQGPPYELGGKYLVLTYGQKQANVILDEIDC